MTALEQPTLMQGVINGQSQLASLRTAVGLRDAADELTNIVDQFGCRALFPASSTAEAVTAVAVALKGNARVVTIGDIARDSIDEVLVVEAVAVSGLKVRRAVRDVRAAGASWVAAAVINDLGESHGDDVGSASGRFGLLDDLRSAD
jgi:hypothetical protein